MRSPTPWTLQAGEFRGRGGEVVRPILDSEGLLVADASAWYRPDTLASNAALIAASPTLRDAVHTLAAVSGTITIDNGMATLPDSSTLDLAGLLADLS